MTRKTTLWIVGIATLVFIAACAWVAVSTQAPNPGFKDAAATVTFITGAAIAIERIIETMWTIIGGLVGTYWPLNAIGKQVETMVKDLDTALLPFHDKARKGLDDIQGKAEWSAEKVKAAKADIGRMQARFDELLKLTPDNQRMQLLAASASQNVAYISKKYGEVVPELEGSIETAKAAINGLQDFLATFKDNPGRRLISIYVGAVIGLIVAGMFSLDLFQAVLQETSQNIPGGLLDVRVILTGLAIGLGSNPTHEIIRAVQEYKEGQKRQNIQNPDLPQKDTNGG